MKNENLHGDGPGKVVAAHAKEKGKEKKNVSESK